MILLNKIYYELEWYRYGYFSEIGYVLDYVQGVAADEEADDIFCQRMVENYENSPDDEKESVPLEECLKEWGRDWCRQ